MRAVMITDVYRRFPQIRFLSHTVFSDIQLIRMAAHTAFEGCPYRRAMAINADYPGLDSADER